MTRGPTPEEYFAQEFAVWEKEWTEAGHLPALFDTVRLAQVNGLALPEWCALAVMNLIIERFNTLGGKKRRSRYVIDFAHWLRWQTLSRMFAMRGIEYAKRPGRPKRQARGIEEAREEASEQLRETIAQGTPRQMQDSFDLVQKAQATGSDARFTFAR